MPAVRFGSHALTHVGLVRQRNEDAFLDRSELGLWAVADGMGGHVAGDFASARIVTALGEIPSPGSLSELADACVARLRDVDAELRAGAAKLGPAAVIASTVVVLLADETEFACLWAGDSRLYRCRDRKLKRLTTDHSRVQELVDAGLLSRDAAAKHPESNIVTRAIGGGRLEFGRVHGPLQPGDRFLLCSDGLTNMAADSEIAQELASSASSAATCERLLALVLARGAVDNVAIIVVAAEPADLAG
jgi:serine/threonine protein phosphatase PrpC